MERPFNLLSWAEKIPLCDGLWLRMQAQNIAMVDMAIIRDMEHEALMAYMERERTPIDILLPLSALSQMWVFSLYEFLRTWRQRATELIKLADTYSSTDKQARKPYLMEQVQKAEAKERHVRFATSTYSEHVRRISQVKFMRSVRSYYKSTDSLFRSVESLRVTLAKHEIPKTPGFVADAPGYGRMSYTDGSIYWFVTLKDDSQFSVTRRDLANAFLGIDD